MQATPVRFTAPSVQPHWSVRAPDRDAPGHRSPASGVLRLARSTALTVTSLALAALAHMVSGGRLPPLGLTVALAVLVGCLSVLVTARRIGPGSTLGLTGGLQLILHATFTLLGGHGAGATHTLTAQSGGHMHTAVTTWAAPLPPQTGAVAITTHAGLASPGAVAMLALHVIATLLSAAALARSERALWQVWTWLQPLFCRQDPVRVFPLRERVRLIDVCTRRSVRARVEHDRRRRGPPVTRGLLSRN